MGFLSVYRSSVAMFFPVLEQQIDNLLFFVFLQSKNRTVYGLPPLLQGLCALMTGTGLLPYIRPLFESFILPGLNDLRAYRPYRRVGFF